MRIETERGACYATDGARRTRLYIDEEAARRAWARGETHTEAEYRELTRVNTQQTVVNRGQR